MKRKLLMTMVMAGVLAAMPVCSVTAAAVPVRATQTREGNAIEPKYLNTAHIVANLLIEGNTAYAASSVTAKKVCKISVVMRLQRKEGTSWNTIYSWIGSSTNGTKSMDGSYTLKERGTYRVYTSFDVGGEQLTYTSPTRTY